MTLAMTDFVHRPVSQLKKGDILVMFKGYDIDNIQADYYCITRINKDTISTRKCSRIGTVNTQDAQIYKHKIPRPSTTYEIEFLQAEHPERDYSPTGSPYLYEEQTMTILA